MPVHSNSYSNERMYAWLAVMYYTLRLYSRRGCMHGWLSCTTPCVYIVGEDVCMAGCHVLHPAFI